MPPETQKEKIMRLLEISSNEAESVIAYDKAIDHDEKTEFDLTEEQQKVAKKMTNIGIRKNPVVYNFDTSKKVRKENPTKAGIIQYLFECLTDCDNVVISNKERQITFSTGGENYELTLVQKRKPK